MAFQGGGAAALDFYDGLEEDNSRAYWQARKAVYEQAVLRPMEELLAEVESQLGAGRSVTGRRWPRSRPGPTSRGS